MEKYSKQNDILKSLNVIIQGLIIGVKESLEYKANTLALLFVMAFNFIILLGVFMITSNIFLQQLQWTLIDFTMFILLSYFCNRFYYLFDVRYLFKRLLLGELNVALTKPTNPFIFQNLKMINGQDIIVLPVLIIPVLALLFTYEFNILMFIFFFVLMCIYNIIFAQFTGSLGFFSKMLPLTLHSFDKQFLNTIRVFTPKVFEFSLARNIIYVLYFSLMGFGLVELLLQREYIIQYFYYSILVMGVLSGITYLNWKFGLKQYEAYG